MTWSQFFQHPFGNRADLVAVACSKVPHRDVQASVFD